VLLGVAAAGPSREERFAAWRLFFERLAEHDPVVMVFEDMHWADDGLLDFIEYLLDWSAQHRIFILTFARPELSERRPGWPAGHRQRRRGVPRAARGPGHGGAARLGRHPA
jgi:hypothetical protein